MEVSSHIMFNTWYDIILQVVKMVDEGHRLPPPPGLSKELYKIMIQCWYAQRRLLATYVVIVTTLFF